MADRTESEDPSNPGEATAGPARPAFISYASNDADTANSICEFLESHGLSCWLAPRNVRPGTHYADAIVRAINEARAVVLVLSASAVASAHVGREVERAASKHKSIIAFRTDAAALSPALEYFLSESQWINVPALGMPGALARLADALTQGPVATPPGDSVIPDSSGVFRRGTRRFALVAALLVGLGVAAGLASHFWSSSRGPAQPTPVVSAIADKSIAVLPFADMSENNDQEYFADGMSEEVLDLLAKIPDLKVIGRTSSFQFKGKSEDLRTIGHILGATYVVEGSVRKAGNQVRITAQLINSEDGSHVWSDTYDKPSGNVLEIQEQIAASLVRALQVTLGADDLRSRPTLTQTEAYDLYLRGRHAYDRFDRSGFEAASGYFQQSLDLEPLSARAAEWLANTLENLAEWGYVHPTEGFERARVAAHRALQLNPRSAMAHATLSAIGLIYDWDWAAAERESAAALALDPRNSQSIGQAGQTQSAIGRWEEGARLIGAALAIDPLFAGWHELLGNIRFREGRYSEAEVELRKTLQISPTYASGHYYLGQVLMSEGKLEEAMGEMQQEAPDSGRDSGLASVYHAMGRKADSNAALARVIKERADEVAYEIAQAHAFRGEADQAFEWLDRAYRQKDVEIYWIKGDPMLKSLKDDSRYKAFLRKMNFSE